MPLKFASGVNVRLPFALSATVPAPATVTGEPTLIAVPLIAVTVSASPSMSLSLVRTLKVTGVSSVAATTSAPATGASLTAAMFRVALAVAVPPLPSDIV